MSFSLKRFVKGILLRGEANDSGKASEGAVWHNSTTNRIKAYLATAVREFVTTDQTQTLTNKTIDVDNNTISNIEADNFKAGVIDTDLTVGLPTDTNIPSALAVKTYVDDVAAAQDDASEITYSEAVPTDWNASPNLVDAGLDELAGRVKTNEGNISTNSSGLSTHISDTTTHGTTGNIVGESDNQTLTNKTIDGNNNTISNLAHGSEVDNPSSGVHGVTGSVVGTSDAQILTNKTIDADNNTISNLAHGAEVDNPTSGVHGVTGNVVGTTDTQTLTNKTFDAASNTLSNVNTTHLGAGVLDTDLTSVSASDDTLASAKAIKSYVDSEISALPSGTPGVFSTSTNYTITDVDGYGTILVDSTGGGRTITLPTAADNTGRKITIKKIAGTGNAVTVDGEGSETIDEDLTWDLDFKHEFITVVSDGSNWRSIGMKGSAARYSLTVSDASSNGWSTSSAKGEVVKDQAGNWTIHLYVIGTSNSTTSQDITISGVSWDSANIGVNIGLAGSGIKNGSTFSTNGISMGSSASDTNWRVGGTILLGSKPTFIL